MNATPFESLAAPLARVYRGATLESVHGGHVAVVDRDGRLLYAAGDPEALTYTRSALKPLQALPFVAAGGDARFGYSGEQVAMLCASHSGEPRHTAAVADMLAKCGARVDELKCGSHVPRYFEILGEFPPPPPYSPLSHNCSGKHAGMLACCTLHGWTRDDYLEPAHPLQVAIRNAVADTVGVDAAAMPSGTDGCSAPNYALPLSRLAFAYARIATAPAGSVLGKLGGAMSAHPGMVSGERRSDLALMQAGAGDWVTKIGAEAVQAVGVRSRGWGIAIKVADGGTRALLPATVAVLDALGLLGDAARDALQRLRRPVLHNARGLAVGHVEPALALDLAA